MIARSLCQCVVKQLLMALADRVVQSVVVIFLGFQANTGVSEDIQSSEAH